MNNNYHFTSDIEPTEHQLEELMQAVLKDVKERAAIADAKFQALHLDRIKNTLAEWRNKNKKVDNAEA